MFGVTTPCVTAVREKLEADGYDCLVFHATGTGGRAMEQLVASGMIDGVLDITTTEVADEVVGGVFPAGPERFDTLLQREIPLVLSLGALDMVNFGAIETVPSEISRPSTSRAQRPSHADADHAGGESADRPLDCRQVESFDRSAHGRDT